MSLSSLKIAVSDRHDQSVDGHSHNYGSWLFWLPVYSSNIQGHRRGGVGLSTVIDNYRLSIVIDFCQSIKIDNFFCEFDCYRLPISIDSNWRLISIDIECIDSFSISSSIDWLRLGSVLQQYLWATKREQRNLPCRRSK